MHIYLILIRRVIKFKMLILLQKIKGRKQKAFQTDGIKIRYACTKRLSTVVKVSFSDCKLCLMLSYILSASKTQLLQYNLTLGLKLFSIRINK